MRKDVRSPVFGGHVVIHAVQPFVNITDVVLNYGDRLPRRPAQPVDLGLVGHPPFMLLAEHEAGKHEANVAVIRLVRNRWHRDGQKMFQ